MIPWTLFAQILILIIVAAMAINSVVSNLITTKSVARSLEQEKIHQTVLDSLK